jgi:hypothetical protein
MIGSERLDAVAARAEMQPREIEGWTLLIPRTARTRRQPSSRQIAKQESFRLEYRLRRHDGEHIWAIGAAAPRFDEHGAFLATSGP